MHTLSTEPRSQRLEKFLAVDPNNTELLYDFAQALEEEGQNRRAIEIYQQLLELGNRTPALLNQNGMLYMKLGEWQLAIMLLQEAVDEDPDAAELVFNLGYSELAIGNASNSREHLEKAITLSPEEAQYHYYLALACDESADHNGFSQSLKTALKHDPDHHGARLMSAFSSLEDGDIAVAKQEVKALLERHPKSLDALVLKAQLALMDFDAKTALHILRDANSSAPDNFEVSLVLGQTYLLLQRTGQARTVLEKAVTINPDSSVAQISLGWSALLQDDLVKAESAFQAAIKLDGEDADGYAGVAIIRFGQKRFPEADLLASKALEFNPDNVPALMVKTALSSREGNQRSATEFGHELYKSHSLGPFGWSTGDIIKRFESSSAVKHILKKQARRIKRYEKNQ